MSAVRMDGKALSAKVRGSILAETEALKKQGRCVIMVGDGRDRRTEKAGCHAGSGGYYRRQRSGERDLRPQ